MTLLPVPLVVVPPVELVLELGGVVLFCLLFDIPTAAPIAIAAMMTSPMGTPKNSQRLFVGLVGTQPRGGL
jgi:hypothetical protein